ncbi:MAG TPA: tryptophan--tRNA ligase [Microthrixaceae bacterium]|nr:tryptophan--tRNA ligase [Microthrixaceae bacterium]RTL09586.1 MAG: tryptophan--tRNA ligase [Acidimicrobiia bacterium]MCB9376208.1 tryptophan--tRNA ligase [Microthrixaceae bacterium]MCB9402059.1 tryptophan--tRNA ligase [Microthrixaceae bacterium]MCC6183601.1 tryptophan--tRNA ligase [Microthrixaceae bacterium]
MPRVFSGIQPTGDLHLGNLLGAVRNWVQDQHDADSFYCIVDLHALTVPKAPGEVGAFSLEMAQTLLACGLDPDVCTLFVQSHVSEHAELAWLVQCVTAMGELNRMTQFKDKSARQGGKQDLVSVGLYTYPALQAADILLYDTDRVPVGEDQRQHIELTRDVAERFNARYGETFVLPEATIPRAGARVMDLQEPTDKMSKSATSDAGVVYLMDDLAVTAKKFKRAVTDSDGTVAFDPVAKPGVSNLLSILGAATGRSPEDLADEYSQYGPLKVDTADAVVALLEPIQARFRELVEDPAATNELLAIGAEKARAVAADVYDRAVRNVGLLPRPVL